MGTDTFEELQNLINEPLLRCRLISIHLKKCVNQTLQHNHRHHNKLNAYKAISVANWIPAWVCTCVCMGAWNISLTYSSFMQPHLQTWSHAWNGQWLCHFQCHPPCNAKNVAYTPWQSHTCLNITRRCTTAVTRFCSALEYAFSHLARL